MTLIVFGSLAARAQSVPDDDFTKNSIQAAAALQQWYNSNGLWETTGWWNAANCVEAIENVIEIENGGAYLGVLDKTFTRNSTNNFVNEYYDDEGWWALAWIRAFDLTGEARYLNMAKSIFADMKTGWDDHCDGGIWWRKDRHYKNAIANELFLLVAIRLHERTPNDNGTGSYFDWALREWNWFKNSGMTNSRNLINDGLNAECKNNRQTTWTYNQGVILGGLTELYKATGESNYLNQACAVADAAVGALVYPDGVLKEPGEPNHYGGADVPQFKGIFIRNLAALYDVTRKPEYHEFILKCARSIWQNDRDSSNRFGFRWTGPVDKIDAARQSSAMFAITAMAEPKVDVSNDLSWKGSDLAHELGHAGGSFGWTADSRQDTASGFLAKGPAVANLPAGSCSAVFELRVDNFNWDNAKVATISVTEADTGKVLASHDLMRGDFHTVLYHSFALPFTAASGHRYDFRTYWYFSPHAPRLTQRSVMVRPSAPGSVSQNN